MNLEGVLTAFLVLNPGIQKDGRKKMDKIYRIIYKMGIFGCWQKFQNKPIDDIPGKLKCIEYVRTDEAKLKGSDIEDLVWLIEQYRTSEPDCSEHQLYELIASEFNRRHFKD